MVDLGRHYAFIKNRRFRAHGTFYGGYNTSGTPAESFSWVALVASKAPAESFWWGKLGVALVASKAPAESFWCDSWMILAVGSLQLVILSFAVCIS